MVNNNLEFENARIIFRNFAGEESKFNKAGDRNFCVVIDNPDNARELEDQGWNVKMSPAREDGGNDLYYLPVKVNFAGFAPPRIKMIMSGKAINITEENAALLDGADIDFVDLVVRPYNWEVNGNEGVSAYCRELYVNCVTSRLYDKYKDLD